MIILFSKCPDWAIETFGQRLFITLIDLAKKIVGLFWVGLKLVDLYFSLNFSDAVFINIALCATVEARESRAAVESRFSPIAFFGTQRPVRPRGKFYTSD